MHEIIQQLSSEHAILFSFFLVAVVGVLVGKLFHLIKLPDISGQVLAGIVLGPFVLGVFKPEYIHNLSFITEYALGIMTFIAGTHLSLKKLHNARRRLLALSLSDLAITFALVFTTLYIAATLFGIIDHPATTTICLLIAALAVSTAPGTIIGLIQSKKARGVLVKTLIGVVALNNVGAIIIFEISKGLGIRMLSSTGTNVMVLLSYSMLYIIEDILIGIIMGWLLSRVTKHQHDNSQLFTSIIMVIMANLVICMVHSKLSGLLVNLAAGATFANLSYHTKRVLQILDNFTEILFAVFFTLAGTHLDIHLLKVAGGAGVLFVLARASGKLISVYVSGRLFNMPQLITRYLGLGLIPQAGLSVGLVISLGEVRIFNEANIVGIITTIVLASVAINEMIGPLTTSKSFDLARESGQSPPRLLDFLHEEYILMPLVAQDKWEAIEEMCRFLVKTNHLYSLSFDDLHESVIKREKEFTTGIGNKLAIPHARIPAKENLMGVIGIANQNPIDFKAVDKKPVDIVILIATPEGKEDLHLKIVGAVAKIFANEPIFHDKLVNAETPAELYDLLQSKEVRDINYFIDEHI